MSSQMPLLTTVGRPDPGSAEGRLGANMLFMRTSPVPCDPAPPSNDANNPLSPRESAVLQLICRGQSNKLIARSLAIAPETVKSHAKNILKKLNAQTRAEAVALAAEMNLLT